MLKLIGKIISVLLLRMNVPKEEVADFTDRVERRDFTMLFENFEAYDVQETRRISRAEGKAEGRAEGKAESILELLEDTGPVTADVKEQIMQEKDPERLRMWLKAAAGQSLLSSLQRTISGLPDRPAQNNRKRRNTGIPAGRYSQGDYTQ